MKTKRFILVAVLLAIVTIVNAQFKIRADNWVHIGYNGYSPIALGNNGTTPNNGQWVIESWEGILNFSRPWPATNAGNFKLFIRDDNGNVGIGLSHNNPWGELETYGSKIRFGYSHQPLDLVLMAQDPRICSSDRVVFYTNSTLPLWIDIECRNVYELSDSSKKTNLIKLQNSLEKIKSINGYNFNWKNDIKGDKQTGLVSQEVEKVIPEIVYTVDSTGEKLLSYTHIIPYLIEAIKEQQNQIETQKKQIDELKKNSSSLKSTNSNNDNGFITGNSLEQNYPNPFSIDTRINMTLSSEIANAFLYIFDMQGTLLKSIEILERGSTQVLVRGSELKPGMYIYTLMADGNEIDTKRMVLTE